MFKVIVSEIDTGEVVKTISDIKTEVKACKVERGLLINMNRQDYMTEIVEIKGVDDGTLQNRTS